MTLPWSLLNTGGRRSIIDLKDGQQLILRNVPELIMGILEITGFTDILNIEPAE